MEKNFKPKMEQNPKQKAEPNVKSKNDHTYQKSTTYKEQKTTKTSRKSIKTATSVPKHLPEMQTIEKCPEKVLDLVKRDDKGEVECLVKYKGASKPEWILAANIRKSYPLLLIDYYETRIILRKNQYEMAFDCTAPSDRKLVVITSK